MPDQIIKKFEKTYGHKRGKDVFYATAKKQHRDPETFFKLKEILKKYVEEVLNEETTYMKSEPHQVGYGKSILQHIKNIENAQGGILSSYTKSLLNKIKLIANELINIK